jgi:putative restriction endonuclease
VRVAPTEVEYDRGVDRDDDVRSSCFASLDVLCATYGFDVPYRGGLDAGFPFRGRRVPFLSPQKGIFRAAVQRGRAALSINTSANSPYADSVVEDGFRYAYRAGSPEQPDNRALRAAFELNVPIVYFVATRPGRYEPIYPCFVSADEPESRSVLVTPGRMRGPLDEREPVPYDDLIERRYAVRETRVRLHQRRFRGQVLVAYRDSCAICRLRETRLLDAAHIVGDSEPTGEPAVSNGLSLCSIHHRAFDEHLVGISPDYEVHVSPRLLDDEDGPMLELLKTFHRSPILVPSRTALRPARDQFAERFERFRSV